MCDVPDLIFCKIYCCMSQGDTNNKDHQRMMVDPMFMILQSLRSFLTAVTPTAVAPIAVILPKFYLI